MNTLIDAVDRTGVLLVLRLGEVLEFSEAMLLGDHCVADQLLALGWRSHQAVQSILVYVGGLIELAAS